MSVLEIEAAIQSLPRSEFDTFAKWFEKIEASRWDEEIAQDAQCGRLDTLVDEALSDFLGGRCQQI